ncbi:hypothetical protein PL321_05395 [Caloramator sp. mosi_1]|nr:hypothetical protein [Caloramator sp. mosi_1]WDC84984.1 hypothetical protein PL321_05395 [Caloramator sp. mosi_1]
MFESFLSSTVTRTVAFPSAIGVTTPVTSSTTATVGFNDLNVLFTAV